MASTMPNQWKTSDASCWQPWAFLNSKPPTSKFKPPSKRKDSAYRCGRSRDWLKMKNPAWEAVTREAEEDWVKGR